MEYKWTCCADKHHVFYNLNLTSTVTLTTINYNNCSHPAVKLNFHPQNSTNPVGELLYNGLINPDRLVRRIDTTKYGFENFTIVRNATHMRLRFIEMNILANEQEFSVEEICGVENLKKEFKHFIKFELVSSTQSPPTTTTYSNSVTTSKPTVTTSKPTENNRKEDGLSAGAIAGIIVASITFVVIIVIIIIKSFF
ncbi:uncharacterized protein LOC114524866 isoform X2 [Dendronephthya gigantea]|uniref:uncharacterized protein LOC114524866 isoform X2 n=1 Tax=Dendronephthya gigantea TaxID=151771 RepID=UPI00106CD67B|nr:uncharacterized protein LOC114524866 isoform X2 [Dendronephthya gigantea]